MFKKEYLNKDKEKCNNGRNEILILMNSSLNLIYNGILISLSLLLLIKLLITRNSKFGVFRERSRKWQCIYPVTPCNLA